MTVVPSEPPMMDISQFVALIQEAAKRKGENGEEIPVAIGTFALYAMTDGGVMVVASANGGPMAGTHHHRISPRMIRALAALAGGGSPIRAVKGMFGGKS